MLANGVLAWRPNARWEVAVRGRGASGLPLTPFRTDDFPGVTVNNK